MTGPRFGIYVHWPFCESKCPYCDFNSHAVESVDHARWRAALLVELAHFASETKGREVGSLFFGGGTPSLMEPQSVAALIAAVRQHWPVADDLEISLEANPSSYETKRFRSFLAAGVGRLSLGVQSFDDARLRFLGRRHTSGQAVRALEEAGGIFPRLSFDLIYALPGETPDAWRRELDQALAYTKGHVSLYQLTIEPGTAFAKARVLGADEGSAIALFELSQRTLAAAGMPAYEISNHARAGEECRHNLLYWTGGDYVGCGPGAHGRLTGPRGTIATRQIARPDAWLAAVEANGHGTANGAALGPEERRDELVMMGLRLTEGLDRAAFRAASGLEIEEALDPTRIERLAEEGFLVVDARGLRATARGRRRLDAAIRTLLA